eukprot:TRINITY_DN823_c0_g1_i1.p1 TRINITY_DN823_c0_g1~~TRINITY_DN823_c0_g1_i1.p1  ORF type:complete len:1231 (-),score=471.75 TRINITY_DN823_c0_g1_i1:58-3750(-)
MSTTFSIPSTLEKMLSRDKDFRYMALADLCVELQKDNFKMDADSERKLTDQILKLLQDNSNTVQEQVVKIMGPFSKKVKDSHITIVETLCNHLLTEKKGTEELRDLASLGLKAVVNEISSENPTLPPAIVKVLTPKLVQAISSNDDKPDTVSYCLDALNTLLERFGSHMLSDHENVLKAIQPQLKSKRNASRKKAIGCLAHLAVTIPDNVFADLVNNLVSNIGDSTKKVDELRTYMQAIGAISRSVGYRLGKYLGEILPRVIKYCKDPKFESDDELRENCFQCFESLILRCPKDITPYLDEIQGLCLQSISHDPNYAQSDDEMETDDAEDEEDDDDQEDYSDDDDMSWKVRRASIKCLAAIFNTRPDLLTKMYSTVAPALIQRFGEREENVKLDVFLAFSDLLKQTAIFARRNPELVAQSGPLQQLVPKIVTGVTKQLKGKSLKTRSGVFSLLRELVSVVPGSLGEHISALIPGIQVSLGDKNTDSNLKIETLSFLRLLLQSHVPTVFHPHMKAFTPAVFKAIKDPYYRTSAEALRVAAELVHVLRPKNVTFDYKPFVQDLFNATLEKLKTQEIDQEVKEAAITCMGLALANLGDELQSQTPEVLKIFHERLGNEITRLTTAKALEVVASSPLHLNLESVLSGITDELASFLSKHNRQLVQTSLLTLGVIVKNYGKETKAELSKNVLSKLAPLISVADLHLTHLSLNLATSLLQANPSSAALLGEQNIVGKSLELLKSSLLGGLALDSLLAFFSELIKTNSPTFGYDSLLEQLVAVVSSGKDTPKQVLSNTAKSVAAITSQTDGAKRTKTVNRFVAEAKSTKDDQSKHLALFALGEIGRLNDLSSHDDLEKSILGSFESSSEETRQAASFALGSVAVGNLKHYLPHVVNEIKTNSKSKYLLLHSLREIIVRQSANPESIAALRSFQDELLPILFNDCEYEEEGVRNVVAECLGKLALVSPQELVPALTKSVSSKSAFTRGTVVSAVKYAIVEKPQPIDSLLVTAIPTFLNSLSDSDLLVRRNTLFTLNYAAHNKPQLIRDVLPQYLPLVYNEAKVKPELIREVDLGPFKHKVDDGLEIRRAAYETMYTLLDSAVDRINISEFIAGPVVDGLNDTYDIKMLSHLMILRLCHTSSASLLESIELLIEPLRVTVTNKVKEGSIQQDVDRNDELVRSTLRAIISITRIPNSESIHKWDEFVRGICKTGELADKYNAIKHEMEHSEVSSNDMDTS